MFPALFTAAMALVDTADSALMVGAYGWAFVQPLRKLWYNLTITAISVLVALLIGGIEALGLISGRLGLAGGIWSIVSGAERRSDQLRSRRRGDLLARLGVFRDRVSLEGLRPACPGGGADPEVMRCADDRFRFSPCRR